MNTYSITYPTLTFHGGVVRYHEPQESREQSGGRRGDILPWMSPSSRRRFMHTLARINWGALLLPVWFVTLTLSPHYWDDPVTVKRALKRFRRRLEYRFGVDRGGDYLGAFWRRELGEGGNVHYHLLLVGPTIDLWGLRAFVLSAWTECCEYAKIDTRKTDFLRVDVTLSETTDVVQRYLAKYVSKAAYDGVQSANNVSLADPTSQPITKNNDTDMQCQASPASASNVYAQSLSKAHTGTEKWGKHWGIWGSKSLPWSLRADISGGDSLRDVAVAGKRIYRKWLERQKDVSDVRQSEKKAPYEADIPFHKRLSICRKSRIRALRKSRRGEVCPSTGEIYYRLPWYEKLRRHTGGYTLIVSQNVSSPIYWYLLQQKGLL